jgi:predicted Fe-Mo cluster-binding NifX family protein
LARLLETAWEAALVLVGVPEEAAVLPKVRNAVDKLVGAAFIHNRLLRQLRFVKGDVMKSLRVAFATNDGQSFMNDHFGDAKTYMMYEITAHGATEICCVNNSTEEEDGVHAAPEKAGNIRQLLQQKGVQVVVAKAFGPNILRIKRHFVCVKVDVTRLEDGIAGVRRSFDAIQSLWQQGDAREYLVLH